MTASTCIPATSELPSRVAEKQVMHVLFSRNFIQKSNGTFLNK